MIRRSAMKKLFAAAFVIIMCVAFAGCGGSSGYSQGEQFQLGDETYALEKWERNIDKDTSASEGYSVCILEVGTTAPIIISGFGTANATATSAIGLELSNGEKTYTPTSIGFQAIDDVEGYGSRITFYFDLPVGEDIPTSGTLTKDGEEPVELDFSGLTVETTTTTTTTTTTSPADLPVDPNYDPEANKGIGDTDVYNPIESFDEVLPDTDF